MKIFDNYVTWKYNGFRHKRNNSTPPYALTATKLSRTQRGAKLQASGSRVSEFQGTAGMS